MTQAMDDRVDILIKQGRLSEAANFLTTHLTEFPNDSYAKFRYAQVLLRQGETKKSRTITEQLLAERPDDPNFLNLSISQDVSDKQYEKAESKAELLIELMPQSSDAFLILAQIKLAQRNYDKAMTAVDQSLSLDAENISALNLRTTIAQILGESQSANSIETALELDPENPSTIASHAYDLLQQGKVKESLERYKYALQLEPTNYMARYGMQEALKSRFLPYRLFFKYKEFTGKLTAGGSWQFIIGIYIAYQVIRRIAAKSPGLEPFLTPLIYIIAGLFLLTWIIDPLMNTYLLSNKYGKILLDEDSKLMAQLCSISLVIGVLSGIGFLTFAPFRFLEILALIGVFGLIPLGTFLHPTKESNRKTTLYFTIGIFAVGFLSLFGNFSGLFLLWLGLIFIYQWVINGILIKENARVID